MHAALNILFFTLSIHWLRQRSGFLIPAEAMTASLPGTGMRPRREAVGVRLERENTSHEQNLNGVSIRAPPVSKAGLHRHHGALLVYSRSRHSWTTAQRAGPERDDNPQVLPVSSAEFCCGETVVESTSGSKWHRCSHLFIYSFFFLNIR